MYARTAFQVVQRRFLFSKISFFSPKSRFLQNTLSPEYMLVQLWQHTPLGVSTPTNQAREQSLWMVLLESIVAESVWELRHQFCLNLCIKGDKA